MVPPRPASRLERVPDQPVLVASAEVRWRRARARRNEVFIVAVVSWTECGGCLGYAIEAG